MGGNALSKPSVRLSKKDYQKVSCDVMRALTSNNPNANCMVIPSYFNKDSFGDLDILVDVFSATRNTGALNPIEEKPNSEVNSIGIDTEFGMFQVDLIYVDPACFRFAYDYFSYNDLGNLLGRIAHRLGFKLGRDGLVYVFRDKTHVLKEIVLTRNYSDALTFLGYNPFQFYRGFADREDIFKYVASSKYANSDTFLLENRNATSRVRDAKRKTYTEFLNWLRDNPLPDQVGKEKDVLRLDSLKRAVRTFPYFAIELRETFDNYQRSLKVKEKFNGVIFSEVTGLSGIELGMALTEFKDNIPDFDNWVLRSSDEGIRIAIKAHFAA